MRLGFGVCCLAERVKIEPGSILQREEQAATLPDLIHFLPRKWRRRISAHTAISSLILFLSVSPPLHLPPPSSHHLLLLLFSPPRTELPLSVGVNGRLVLQHVCLDRREEKGRAEVF